MARPVRLFVSSSPDLMAEREIVGQVLAGLPISVGWEVQYTPLPGEVRQTALLSVAECDLFLTLLGQDFAAPMGAEWADARRHGRSVLAYRKGTLHSPSAQMHLRDSKVAWQDFDTLEKLRAPLTRQLAQMLLDRGEYFGLHLPEVEGLLELLKTKEDAGPGEEDQPRTGAGRGGVILGRGNI